MPTYTCFRCNKYKCTNKSFMYNHLCRTIKCPLDEASLKYNDDQITKFSLIYEPNCHELLAHKDYKISMRTNEFILELKQIFNQKRKKCNYCHKEFSKYKELESHLFLCIYINNKSNGAIDMINKNNDTTSIVDYDMTNVDGEINPNNINIVNNIGISNHNHNNNNYNIQINVNIQDKTLVSFDEMWNTEHLDINAKILLFLSSFNNKYTKTLEMLLDNDINKNVLLDNDSNMGIIYKNEKLEKMKIKDIVSESIDKLQKHLLDFSKDIIKNCDGINDEIIKSVAKDTRFELLNYKNEKEHKIDLSPLIISTFNKHKEETRMQYLEYQKDGVKLIEN